MPTQQDLESHLSALEIAFFSEGEREPTEDVAVARRAHVSRHWKWVVTIVAAAVVLIAMAAHEHHQATAGTARPTSPAEQSG